MTPKHTAGSGRAVALLIPMFISISYIFLANITDLRLEIPELIATSAWIVLLLALTLYLGKRGLINWSPWFILILAMVLRLIFLFKAPQLSDDIFRYVWDGAMLNNGVNPYGLPPLEVLPQEEFLKELVGDINHSNLVTIYPPAAQLIFAAGARLDESILGMKILLVVFDLITCGLLIMLLHRLQLPTWRAVLYAWHPLPILEIAGSGHIDGAALLFVLLFLVMWRPTSARMRSLSASGGVFAASILVKLFPLVYLPGILLLLPRQGRRFFLLGLCAVGVILVGVFMPQWLNSLETLSLYARDWEFAGFLFQRLRSLYPDGSMIRYFLSLCFLLVAIYVYKNMVHLFSPNYRIVVDGGVESIQLRNLLRSWYVLSMFFLLLTTTLHPWYALYLSFLLPFCGGPAGLVLSWSVLLGYQVLTPYAITGQWVENNLTAFYIWSAPVAAFVLTHLITFFKKTKPAI